MQNKPKILVFPFDLLAHYTRSIALVEKYADTHTVLFNSSANYDHLLKEEQISTFSCETFDSQFVLNCMKKFRFDWLNDKDVKRVFIDQVRCIREHKPQFVIGDTSPTLKMAAEYTGVKFISLINGYISKYYALERPITDSHPAYFIKKLIPSDIFRKIQVKMEYKAFVAIHRPFKKLRESYQLSEKAYYLDEMEGDITFLCDDERVFPQQPLPEGYKIIGPLFYNPKGYTTTLPKEIDPLKKNILVSFGSSGEWDQANFLNSPLLSKYNIITAGDKTSVLKGPHIFPMAFANFNSIIKNVHLLICHGGNGTLNLSYKHGVPFIALPSIMEQEWNALRFQELGAGFSYSKKKSATEKDSIIQKILNEVWLL